MQFHKLTYLPILITASTLADVRTAIPPDPGPPLYSYLQRNLDGSAFYAHDTEWAAIWFYRDPGCIPSDFNLLDAVDLTPAFPSGPPRPFVCPLTVNGFAIWKNGPPPVDSVPAVSNVHGSAVPVWFVKVSELQAAVADDKLTIDEIGALPSLRKGVAQIFNGETHYGTYRPQGFGNGSIEQTASGTLQDGTSFQVEYQEMGVKNGNGFVFVRHARIAFK